MDKEDELNPYNSEHQKREELVQPDSKRRGQGAHTDHLPIQEVVAR